MERTQLAELLAKAEKAEPSELSDQEIVALLGLTDPEDCRMLKDAAFRRTTALMGPYVYYRGLIELSNICTANCRYCGIRKANHDVKRYTMTKEEIVEAAVWAADNDTAPSVCRRVSAATKSSLNSSASACGKFILGPSVRCCPRVSA